MKLRKHVLVVGGGFGGIAVTRALRAAPVRVTLIDRSNHHLFQPLLYQVAMAGLSPAEIAVPIRSVFRHQDNVRVLLDDVTGVNLPARRIEARACGPLEFDFLVLAPGAVNSYFGRDHWAAQAPGLKDLDDAVEIRRRVLMAFEAAERETDPIVQRKHLTFVVIGAGPTGVELAGAIAELATFVLSRDFRAVHPDQTQVLLIEAGPRVLPSFSEETSAKARQSLADMGVEVRTGVRVTAIDGDGVQLGDQRIAASTVLWAAGVKAAPLVAALGLPTDRGGRVEVERDCALPGHPNVFCIGDAAAFRVEGAEGTSRTDGAPGTDRPAVTLPGVSAVAMQQGRFVADAIEGTLEGRPRKVFRYLDKGSMATIGRSRAVAEVAGLRLSGFLAWFAWLSVHIFYLIDFRNRLLVLIDWAWSYFTYRRGSRLITGHRQDAGAPAPGVQITPPSP